MVRTFLTVIFVFGLGLVGSAQSIDSIPKYDVENQCSESKYDGFSDPKGLAMGCKAKEANFRTEVESLWAISTEETRRDCVAIGLQAYQFLYNCLAKAQPVAAPSDGDPCNKAIYRTRLAEREQDATRKEIKRLGEISCDTIPAMQLLYKKSFEQGSQITALYVQLKATCPSIPSVDLNSAIIETNVQIDQRQLKALRRFQESYCSANSNQAPN